MKRLMILFIFANICNKIVCQEYQELNWEVEIGIQMQFESSWEYFRMKKNPLLSFEETHDRYGQWKNPFLVPDSFYLKHYLPNLKISHWGEPAIGSEKYVNMGVPYLFLVEKRDGLLGIREDYATGKMDSILINVYDSIFPYDNRFLVAKVWRNGKYRYTFHSGNAMWGDWNDVGFTREVDMVGYVRGVQFGVDKVKYYNQAFSARIRQARPDYPDYEYTEAHHSLLSNGRLLISAPRGKEDQLIEFIYFSDDPKKTGEKRGQMYEFRYIMPTQIQSVSERHWEVRKLSEEEMATFFNEDNPLRCYMEWYNPWEDKEEVIIKKEE